MPRILIERADDTRTYEETYLRFSDSESMSEVKLNPRQYRRANNPMIEAITVFS